MTERQSLQEEIMTPKSKLTILLIAIISAIMILLSGCGSSSPSSSAGGGGGTGGGGGGATVPAAPILLSATPASGQVTLSWTAVTGATSYNVYWSTATGTLVSKTKVPTPVAVPGIILTGLANGTPYFFQVTAVNANGESAGSNEVSATPNPPGTNWSTFAPTGVFIPQLSVIRFLNNQWVTAGFNALWTMNNGVVNNTIVIPLTGTVYSLAYGNGMYVATGSSNSILTSLDSINWVARISAFPKTFFSIDSVAFGNGKFVAVSSSGWLTNALSTEQVQTSVDGVTWVTTDMTAHAVTNIAGTYYPAFYSITFGNGKFVAAGKEGNSNDALVFTSPDGVVWTRQNTGLPVGNSLAIRAVRFVGGQFIAVGWSGLVLTSPDGITWTKRTAVTPNTLTDVAFGGGTYIAVGATGTIIQSIDNGVTWNPIPSITTTTLNSIDFANNQFIAVGQFLIITSP